MVIIIQKSSIIMHFGHILDTIGYPPPLKKYVFEPRMSCKTHMCFKLKNRVVVASNNRTFEKFTHYYPSTHCLWKQAML